MVESSVKKDHPQQPGYCQAGELSGVQVQRQIQKNGQQVNKEEPAGLSEQPPGGFGSRSFRGLRPGDLD